MVEKARAEGGTFLQGDMREVAALAGAERFGAAICVGNALPHLTADEDLQRLARGLRDAILPRGPVILQLLNYDRIEAKRERALPLMFLPDGIVFLRAMELREGGQDQLRNVARRSGHFRGLGRLRRGGRKAVRVWSRARDPR